MPRLAGHLCEITIVLPPLDYRIKSSNNTKQKYMTIIFHMSLGHLCGYSDGYVILNRGTNIL